MKKIFGIITITLLFVSLFGAKTLAANDRTPSGVLFTQIAELTEEYIEKNKESTVSVALALISDQDTVYEIVYGYADIEKGLVASFDTVYEWGSVTKLLVWVSVMQLWEAGKINLEVDIKTYLPDNFLTNIKYDTPITMLDLMNHTAGFEEMLIEIFVQNKENVSTLEDALLKLQPDQIFPTGEVRAYSNWGVGLAGYVVENISGIPFYEYVHKNIFEVLGMKHTALNGTLSDNEWVNNARNTIKGYTANLQPASKHRSYMPLYPAGMATGTLLDFQTFAKALITENTPLFKSDETLDKMLSPTMFYGDTDYGRSAHGFFVTQFAMPVYNHRGNTTEFSSSLLLEPESKTALVIMTNRSSESIYNSDYPKLVFGEFKPKADDNSNVKDIKGIYYSTRTVTTGFLKLYTLVNTFPLLFENKGIISTPRTLKAMSISLELIGKDIYIASITIGDINFKKPIYVSGEGQDTKLMMPYMDVLPISSISYVAKLVLLLLCLLAFIYFVLVFILFIILTIRAKVKKLPPCIFRQYTAILCIVIKVIAVNNFILFSKLSKLSITIAQAKINVGLNAVLAIIPIIYTALLIIKFKKLECQKIEKVLYIVSSVMGLIITLAIIVWQLYKL